MGDHKPHLVDKLEDAEYFLPNELYLPFMLACGNIIPLRWIYLKSVNLIADGVQSSSKDNVGSLAKVFYELGAEGAIVHHNISKKGRPATNKERDRNIVSMYKKMLNNPPKNNTTPYQYKSQVKQSLSKEFCITVKNLDKILERFKSKTLEPAYDSVTEMETARWFVNELCLYGINLSLLMGMKSTMNQLLESEGFPPNYMDKPLEELQRYQTLTKAM